MTAFTKTLQSFFVYSAARLSSRLLATVECSWVPSHFAERQGRGIGAQNLNRAENAEHV